MVNRNSYLGLYMEQIKQAFDKYVSKVVKTPNIWFEMAGKPV